MRIRTKLTTGVLLLVTLYAVTALFFVTTLRQQLSQESRSPHDSDQLAGYLAEPSVTTETEGWIEGHHAGDRVLAVLGSRLSLRVDISAGIALYPERGVTAAWAMKVYVEQQRR